MTPNSHSHLQGPGSHSTISAKSHSTPNGPLHNSYARERSQTRGRQTAGLGPGAVSPLSIPGQLAGSNSTSSNNNSNFRSRALSPRNQHPNPVSSSNNFAYEYAQTAYKSPASTNGVYDNHPTSSSRPGTAGEGAAPSHKPGPFAMDRAGSSMGGSHGAGEAGSLSHSKQNSIIQASISSSTASKSSFGGSSVSQTSISSTGQPSFSGSTASINTTPHSRQNSQPGVSPAYALRSPQMSTPEQHHAAMTSHAGLGAGTTISTETSTRNGGGIGTGASAGLEMGTGSLEGMSYSALPVVDPWEYRARSPGSASAWTASSSTTTQTPLRSHTPATAASSENHAASDGHPLMPSTYSTASPAMSAVSPSVPQNSLLHSSIAQSSSAQKSTSSPMPTPAPITNASTSGVNPSAANNHSAINTTSASSSAATAKSMPNQSNPNQSIPIPPVPAPTTTTSPHRLERMPSSRPRKDTSASAKSPVEITVVEFAIINVCETFRRMADNKLAECAPNPHDHPPRIEAACGPGADANLDRVVTALGHLGRTKPKPIVDSIMYWRRGKSETCAAALAAWEQIRDSGRPTEVLQPVWERYAVAERRLAVSIYLVCRVLMSIYDQATSDSLAPLSGKLEDVVFNQLTRLDADAVQTSVFQHANWIMCGRLLGKISGKNLAGVASRFLNRVQQLQDAASHAASLNNFGNGSGNTSTSGSAASGKGSGGASSSGLAVRDTELQLELIVRAMRHLAIRTEPDGQWRDSCETMCSVAKIFIHSHGQPIKHAYCQVLENLVFPVAATSISRGSHFSTPRWRDFLHILQSRVNQMLTKPRHWAEAFPLSVLLLCAAPSEVFFAQWTPMIAALQSKLKDRVTRILALQALARLTWTFLDRSADVPLTIRKLEELVKMLNLTGKKSLIAADPAVADPIIDFIRVITFRFPDFGFRNILFPLLNADLFLSGKEIRIENVEPERAVVGIRAFLAVVGDVEHREAGPPAFPCFDLDNLTATQNTSDKDDRRAKPVQINRLDDFTRSAFLQFCDILGKITLLCDSTFGGQAALEEKLGVQTPKTPISETFGFSRSGNRDEPAVEAQRQGFYELFYTAVQSLPRCVATHIPFNSLINLLCTGSAHVQPLIAQASVVSLKAIARQGHAQPVTIGFARFIFNYDVKYATMSDEGLLGPGHIQSTLQLYLDLLEIWIEEVKAKSKSASAGLSSPPGQPDDAQAKNRSLQMDLTSTSALVEEVESHGLFFLCSQSRRVRSYAVNVLRLVPIFDAALQGTHGDEFRPRRLIQILQGDLLQVISPDDDRLTVAERSRLQKGKHPVRSRGVSTSHTSQYPPSGTAAHHDTLIDLCGSDGSYDHTLWLKVFPNLIRLSFEQCQLAVTLARDIVCARLLQMHGLISTLAEGSKTQASTPLSAHNTTAAGMMTPDRSQNHIGRMAPSQPDSMIEQWKLYLVMACTTIKSAGAQTQSQLQQHSRSKSRGPGSVGEKIGSARSLFAFIIPLLRAAPVAIREAIVTALGSISVTQYRILLESLQYAVTTCNEEAKLRANVHGAHQRTGSNPRRNRGTDRLRTEVTHVYKLTARFLHSSESDEVLRDDWILTNLIRYTDDMRLFLSDAEVQGDWEFQLLRQHYCGLLEAVHEGINRTSDPSRWMSFEGRKAAFGLMEDWCGYSPNQTAIAIREDSMRQAALSQQHDTGERTNITASIEIQKRALRVAALSAMASLCGGPISVIIDASRGTALSFDVRRILSWIDQIFDTVSDKMHQIGQRALKNLILHNRSFPKLLEHTVDMCLQADRPKPLESYFDVVTSVFGEHADCYVPFWRILCAILFTLGNEKSAMRMKSARLLRTLEQRRQRTSKLQDFDISVSDRTAAVYKLAQFEIGRRLSHTHADLAFFVVSQFAFHYKKVGPDHQRAMIPVMLPWIQVIELQLDPQGGPTLPTYMLLVTLLEITTKSGHAMHNEVQALWQALATGPHGGNVQVVLNFVIALCIERREQSFVDYARQIVVFLSSTPAGQKVIEFLLLQLTPKNMVHAERKPMEVPTNVVEYPYIADLREALPIGNKQNGLSLGQLSLILLVDLIVAPVQLSNDQVPLLLQVCLILWDQYISLVQEQAREMLVHLIHELVLTQIDEDKTASSPQPAVEDFVDAIRQSSPTVTWTYHESNSKEAVGDGARVPQAMERTTQRVIEIFAPVFPDIHQQWAKTTLTWATSCSVRHLACRSFQIFRCILKSLDHAMLADMLARLSNTIADETHEVQSFSMEILTTIKTIIGVLERAELLLYPQLFWAACACLNTVNEREFIETLGMVDVLLAKVDLSDPAVVKILLDARPERWVGSFEGIMPLVYRGLKSSNSLEQTLSIIDTTASLPDNKLIGDQGRLLFGVLAELPSWLETIDADQPPTVQRQRASTLASVAETDEHPDLAAVLHTFANGHFGSRQDFLTQAMVIIRQDYFPTWQTQTFIFLMSMLSNSHAWMKTHTLDILNLIVPHIDMKTLMTTHGTDALVPLLRLLTSSHAERAQHVLDAIMTQRSAADARGAPLAMQSGLADGRADLYGSPKETGWSLPAPERLAGETRSNIHAVFVQCVSVNAATPDTEPTATPDITFDNEEVNSYFSPEPPPDVTDEVRTVNGSLDLGTTLPPEPLASPVVPDLVSKLDSLDDFFSDGDTVDGSTDGASTEPYADHAYDLQSDSLDTDYDFSVNRGIQADRELQRTRSLQNNHELQAYHTPTDGQSRLDAHRRLNDIMPTTTTAIPMTRSATSFSRSGSLHSQRKLHLDRRPHAVMNPGAFSSPSGPSMSPFPAYNSPPPPQPVLPATPNANAALAFAPNSSPSMASALPYSPPMTSGLPLSSSSASGSVSNSHVHSSGPARPSLHSRSITSPSNPQLVTSPTNGVRAVGVHRSSISHDEAPFGEEVTAAVTRISGHERAMSTQTDTPPVFETIVRRTRSNTRTGIVGVPPSPPPTLPAPHPYASPGGPLGPASGHSGAHARPHQPSVVTTNAPASTQDPAVSHQTYSKSPGGSINPGGSLHQGGGFSPSAYGPNGESSPGGGDQRGHGSSQTNNNKINGHHAHTHSVSNRNGGTFAGNGHPSTGPTDPIRNKHGHSGSLQINGVIPSSRSNTPGAAPLAAAPDPPCGPSATSPSFPYGASLMSPQVPFGSSATSPLPGYGTNSTQAISGLQSGGTSPLPRHGPGSSPLPPHGPGSSPLPPHGANANSSKA